MRHPFHVMTVIFRLTSSLDLCQVEVVVQRGSNNGGILNIEVLLDPAVRAQVT